jgi:SAM-dependent methyltransferase
MPDPTQRFSSRVCDYASYRPGYPTAVAALLRDRCGLGPGTVVADLGSGTGRLTQLLLDAGCAPARREIRRILKPGGYVALVWNDRDELSPLAREYEEIVRVCSTDYQETDRRRRTDEASLGRFFTRHERASFANPQPAANLESLLGRYRSASYALTTADPRYPEVVEAIAGLIARHGRDGRVEIPLSTVVVWGTV